MDRIGGLNGNQVAKELQTYKKYHNKTQKEIKNKVGNVSALRDELRRLENKKSRNRVDTVKYIDRHEFTGVKDIDIILLHMLKNKELYNICQTNKYIHDICHSDIILKKRVDDSIDYIKFPMISQYYYFVNKPDINIKNKGIQFNPDKYDTVFKMNTVYTNIDGIIIYLTDYEEQYFNEKIIITDPITLTLKEMIELIIKYYNEYNMNNIFLKKYKKGAVLMGLSYHNDGYYLILDRYL